MNGRVIVEGGGGGNVWQNQVNEMQWHKGATLVGLLRMKVGAPYITLIPELGDVYGRTLTSTLEPAHIDFFLFFVDKFLLYKRGGSLASIMR